MNLSIDQARELILRIFRDHPTKNFAVRLWDGSEVRWQENPAFTLIFRDADTLKRCFASRDLGVFGQSFIDNTFDIEGDIYAALELGRYVRTVKLDLGEILKFAVRLGLPKTRHTREDDVRDVQAHYDLSNDFYKLFLDTNMAYSCAYFGSPEMSLEEAQERKLDLVCKKLRLKPGEKLLDVGCGWGALILWAAKHYGVTAHGITLSQNQYDLAKARIAEAGLEDHVTVEMKHYLDLPQEAYDKISSVGMIEHVGISKYPEYFGALYRALKPGGLVLNHGITVKQIGQNVGGNFIMTYVFPGAELDTISHTLVETEGAGFEILDVEDLRPHYALTLREWMKRFTANKEKAAALVPEKVMRTWQLYLPGCALAFEEGTIAIHQTLAAKNDAQGKNIAPLTRKDILI